MAPLAVLPVFLKLSGRRAIVAGGDAAAVWKAELLAAAGAHVTVHAEAPGPDMVALASGRPAGTMTLLRHSWTPDVFAGASLAVGAIEDEVEARAFRDAARAAGVPVNVVDKPELCDVQFGGIVNRSPLVIGISTDGAAPVFGQAVRARIEAILPQGLARWALAAKAWRRQVQASRLPVHARRRFWDLFSRAALDRPDATPGRDQAEHLFEAAAAALTAPAGRLILVGAGPGDPELLTMKAVRALQSADVIVHDDLVAPAILDVARREARRISAGKRGHGPSCNQAEINALVIGLARQGQRVIRLKSGDPMIFGRAGEEIAAARAAGIAVEVVPGITAAQGAAASLSLSLTHREHARRLQYVTGHGRDGGLPDDLDWQALVDPAASTVVYMAGKTWVDMAEALLRQGLRPDMPAVAVVNATRADEIVIRASVATLAARLAAERFAGPLLILYGEAFGADAVAGAAAAAAIPGSFTLPSRVAAAPFS
ncbi:uroporphyrinogen-III C-methyltransferase [Phreatobacter stygius]|uniref:Uroporphyrinogen-III C-methyltransferase n=2 Tax=Phreatobacter stygius TaxID=1940610 RepID=A0A4D7B685_9HYPH|nr:uroporphyrinogen-III C-methyltransferase [Phreatobacter stygius]